MGPLSLRVLPPRPRVPVSSPPFALLGVHRPDARGPPVITDTHALIAEVATGVQTAQIRHLFNDIPLVVFTPVSVPVLRHALASHPDRNLVDFVLQGFTFGFDIGFRGLGVPSRPNNLRSARNNSQAVTDAICKEITRGHTAGPFQAAPLDGLHCSPLGSAPKKDGSVRLVLDLSSPRGWAINEDISRDNFSVVYSSFDDAVRMVGQLGSDVFMAKIDIRHAFRLCPVRLDQIHLLGFRWLSWFFVDLRLPFGSRSSPFIFSQFADLLAWVLINVVRIAFLLHYLDDFFLAARSQSLCQRYMTAMLDFCHAAGIPIAHDKTVGPSSRITYLGIEIDAVQQQVRLPDDKLVEIQELVKSWTTRRKATKRELLSLIASLSFAAKVVQPGRLFLRRLIDLSTVASSLSHHIYINNEARADIMWWHRFLRQWNGIQMFCIDSLSSIDLELATDASAIGIGAVCGSAWFSAPLPPSFVAFHINTLELFAVFAAVVTWGRQWAGRRVLIFTDNSCVVQVASSGTCKDKDMMRILRELFFFTAEHKFRLSFRHIPGINNCHADSLSRLQVRRFLQLSPQANEHPVITPAWIWHIFDDNDKHISSNR